MTFLLTLVGYFAYSAYTQLPTVQNGDSLTADKWNAVVTTVNQIGKDLSNLTNLVTATGGNVGIGNTNPQLGLDVSGDFARKVFYTTMSSACGSGGGFTVNANTWTSMSAVTGA